MEIIVTSIAEMRTRVNSVAKVSYQQVYSSGLYMIERYRLSRHR